jgi:hypothetical protein
MGRGTDSGDLYDTSDAGEKGYGGGKEQKRIRLSARPVKKVIFEQGKYTKSGLLCIPRSLILLIRMSL